jgi:gamma-glutamyltranspeptidase / glutathione hydrolase
MQLIGLSKWARQCRISIFLFVCTVGLAGCAEPKREVAFVSGFLGGAIADEPRAALIAREVLAQGGTAADAMVAAMFALTVTMPASAGLGGGGACLVRDEASKKTETLDFLPRGGGRQAIDRGPAVPGLARGALALHARYGRTPWERLVLPAEALARDGHPISRALAHEFQKAPQSLLDNPAARRMFLAGREKLPAEGERIESLDLAASLAAVRIRGAGELYSGALARKISAAYADARAPLAVGELRDYRVEWRSTVSFKAGTRVVHFPAIGGGAAATARMWGLLGDGGAYEAAAQELRPHLLAEASRYAARHRAAPVLPGEAKSVQPAVRSGQKFAEQPLALGWPETETGVGLVVVDRRGAAVACTLTLNGAFGTGVVAPGTGLLISAAPNSDSRFALGFAMVMVVNENVNDVYFAATATGGTAAPAALAQVLLEVEALERPLENAIDAARIGDLGSGAESWYEEKLAGSSRAALDARGHRTASKPRLGLVNGIHCQGGLVGNPGTCTAAVDGRGFGLAATTIK